MSPRPATCPGRRVGGILLLLRAFASGCSALTGVEAIANAVPSFREPRVRRAQHTEMWLGIILGVMLIGVAILIRKFHVAPSATQTSLAQLAAAAVGHNVVFYAIQLITTVLLALAANKRYGRSLAILLTDIGSSLRVVTWRERGGSRVHAGIIGIAEPL